VDIGSLFGWEQPLGHLTGGGTMANLEALWVAGRLQPGKRVLASEQAHYTHGRISEVLGMPFSPVPVQPDGRMDPGELEKLLAEGDVGTVVASIGSTGLGAVDALGEILALRDRYEFSLHADAAYGGYFGLSSQLDAETAATYALLGDVDSIVIDPHKHGLQPYGCGCVLFRDPSVGRFYKHGSPYTYFSSAELHLGEISLECSRPGAAAVALWATQQLLPLEKNGDFADGLDACLLAAREFRQRLKDSEHYTPLMHPELDIVVYVANAADSREASKQARRVFDAAAESDLHLALAEFPASLVAHYVPDLQMNSDTVTCLRSVLMKPEHHGWLDQIMGILEDSARIATTPR
jgi:glutamate/tyrosine decarboxylase-like PLP-dependent enzyme